MSRSDRRPRAGLSFWGPPYGRIPGARAAIAFALATGCVLGLAPAAHADDAPPPPQQPVAPSPEPAPSAAPAPAQPGLDALRERFREGMDDYRAERYGDAILKWERIYAELGEEKGYRLVFNIARAFDARGDLADAAERYDAYLEEVERHRREATPLEPNVEKQADEARERLTEIEKRLVRVHVDPRGSIARVGKRETRTKAFVVYVEPGPHIVTFGTGKGEEVVTIDAKIGEPLDVFPKPTTEAPPPPARFETRTERPFSPAVLWIAGGVTVASLVVPLVTYLNASSTKSDFDAQNAGTQPTPEQRRSLESLQSTYNDERNTAYASLAVPAVAAAGTAALAAWYFLGKKEVLVPVEPQAAVSTSGATLGLSGRF